MEKGTIIVGTLVGFTYVGQEKSYCKVTIQSDGKQYRAIVGEANLFPLNTMLGLMGADAKMSITYNGEKDGYPQFKDATFSL